MFLKQNFHLSILQKSFYFFPLAFIAGSIVLNFNTIFFIIVGGIYLLINKIKIRFNIINLSLLIFFLILILSSYLNLNTIGKENFIKSFFLLRFFCLFVLIETLIANKKIELRYFFYISFFASLFLSLDLALQFFYGKNILGFEPWQGRITGVFEDEAVAGAYIQKFFIFALIFVLTFQNDMSKIKHFYILISLIIIIFASFIASNRISFLILISTVVFVIFFYQILRKKLIVSFLILLPIFYHYYQTDPQTNMRYKALFIGGAGILGNEIIKSKFFKKIYGTQDQNPSFSGKKTDQNLSKSIKKNNITLPNHGKIYLTAFKSFNENKFLGNGLKSFRYECKKFLNLPNTLCSTHPHNYHLEVLHDAGLAGIFFMSIFVISLLIKTSKLMMSKNLSHIQKIIISLIILNFLIEIFPLKSTGSIFTTWNGTLLWVSICLMNYKNYKNNYEKNKFL